MRKSFISILIVVCSVMLGAATSSFDTWDQYLGSADSSQYSSLKQINKSNVKQLEIAWTFETGGFGNMVFGPTVVDGIMYVWGNGALIALDPATGKEIWRHPGDTPSRGVNYWESKDKKDRRLVYTAGGRLRQLDARSGEAITSFGDNGSVDLKVGLERNVNAITSNNPGRVIGDIYVIPLAPSYQASNYEATPGDVHAYDIRTGKLLWQFHSVPHPGEYGYDSWPKDAWQTLGGVHNWGEFTVDEQRGVLYIPFGTARYDFYGANRRGNNLYGNSLVALDVKTGKRIWHFQTVHHDLWDYDVATAPKLLTIRHDGRNVDVVAQPTKHGFLFVFDRVTGNPIWPIVEKSVPQTDVPGEWTSPTQPFPTAPPPFARQSFREKDVNPFLSAAEQEEIRQHLRASRNEGLFTPPSLKGTIEMPGSAGGANWGSAAVDPTKGTMYIVSKDLPMGIRLIPPAGRSIVGAINIASARGAVAQREPCPFGTFTPQFLRGAVPAPILAPAAGRGVAPAAAPVAARGVPLPPPVSLLPADFVQYDAPYDFMNQTSCGLSMIGPPWSQITAYDLNKGTILWQVPDGGISALEAQGKTNTGAWYTRGGIVVTAGGLIFAGSASDRTFRAYDQDTGAVLWEYILPAGTEGVPAVYQIANREYVVIPSGGDGQTPTNTPRAPLAQGSYIAFALPKK